MHWSNYIGMITLILFLVGIVFLIKFIIRYKKRKRENKTKNQTTMLFFNREVNPKWFFIVYSIILVLLLITSLFIANYSATQMYNIK